MRFLYDHGYVSSYQTLCSETNFSLSQIDVADNVDLWTVVQEYVNYYHQRYGRSPKLVRQPYAEYQLPSTALQVGQYPIISTAATHVQHQPNGSALLPTTSTRSAQQQGSLHVTSAGSPVKHDYDQQAHADSYKGQTSAGGDHNVFVAHTTRKDTQQCVTQDEYVQMIVASPNVPISDLFDFTKPKKTNSKRRSVNLALNETQEEALYALVGCQGIGWLIKNINQNTKALLQQRFAIDKETLQLFFKNRAQKATKKPRTSGSTGDDKPSVVTTGAPHDMDLANVAMSHMSGAAADVAPGHAAMVAYAPHDVQQHVLHQDTLQQVLLPPDALQQVVLQPDTLQPVILTSSSLQPAGPYQQHEVLPADTIQLMGRQQPVAGPYQPPQDLYQHHQPARYIHDQLAAEQLQQIALQQQHQQHQQQHYLQHPQHPLDQGHLLQPLQRRPLQGRIG